MKKSVERLVVGGREYPCRITMGAMLRYKEETGRDAADISDSTDIMTFLWCCVRSACNADHLHFDMSLMDFLDAVDAGQAAGFAGQLAEDTVSVKKKRQLFKR